MSKTKVSDSYEGLMNRSKVFLDQLISRLNKDHPEIDTIIIFTHAATKISLGRVLLDSPEEEIRTGTCSLDTYVLDNKSNKWVAQSIGETHFLTEGEEMHWDFSGFSKILGGYLCFDLLTPLDPSFAAGSTEDFAARQRAKAAAEREKVVSGKN